MMLPSHEYQVTHCAVYKEQVKAGKWECTAHGISMYNDMNCQCTLCYDKNCQDTQCVHMQPVKPAKKSSHVWSVEPAIPQCS